MDRAVLGLDIGGTKLAAGVVADGRVLVRGETPTCADEGPDAVLARLLALARRVQAGAPGAEVDRLGVGCAGPLDRRAGLILSPPNLPGWDRFPLVARLAGALSLPVRLENDANAAALAEYRYGAGRGATSLVYLTVSTGIGGGIILDGRLWHGSADAAGEVGHMILLPDGPPCGCGNRGCWEALASGPAIARRARERLETRASRLRVIPAFTAADVARLAAAGDPVAVEVWDEAVGFLAQGIAALVTTLAPERVVLGGGVSRAGDLLFVPLRERVRRHVRLAPAERIPILPAALGADVGILGAAAIALED